MIIKSLLSATRTNYQHTTTWLTAQGPITLIDGTGTSLVSFAYNARQVVKEESDVISSQVIDLDDGHAIVRQYWGESAPAGEQDTTGARPKAPVIQLFG